MIPCFIPILVVVVIVVFICFQGQLSTSDNSSRYTMSGGGDHRFTVKEPWFSKIKSGEKDVEGRLHKGRFQKIHDGDEIVWINKDTDEEVKTTVLDHKIYDDISDMIKGVGHKKLMPGSKSSKEVQEAYDSYYRPEQQKEHKAIAIYLKKNE